jgi:hypothetical protein
VRDKRGAYTVSWSKRRSRVEPATPDGIPVGAPVIPVTAGYYFWNQ